MKAIRLTIVDDFIISAAPRRISFIIREVGGEVEMWEAREGTADADSEKCLSVGPDRDVDLKLIVETCDV